ncbi:MAG: hypothetical protein GX606_04255 [Elusimicrobia bacterium]|nr:hypothetical protein [Elusimicrobiota bacterium]
MLCGCSANRLNDPLAWYAASRMTLQEVSFNLSAGTNKSVLIIRSQPASTQDGIKYHYFIIDDRKITVSKNSLAAITLDAGRHAVTGGVNMFGFPTGVVLEMEEGKEYFLLFRGPLDIMTSGRFWQFDPQNLPEELRPVK